MKYSIICLICLVSGCAHYTYQKQGNDCSIEIMSTRDVSQSSLAIQDCNVAGSSEFERAAAMIAEIIRALNNGN